jgi:palmitoyl-protein thioesterase
MGTKLKAQMARIAISIASDPMLAGTRGRGGFNFYGESQGGLLARSYVTMHNDPPVYNLVAISGPQAGVGMCPEVDFPVAKTICAGGAPVLGVYSWPDCSFCDFWKGLDEKEYLKKSNWLAAVNNDRPDKVASHAANMKTLNFYMASAGSDDKVVQPRESAWHTFWKWGGKREQADIVDWRETESYKGDWLGLQTLDKQGKLEFNMYEGTHTSYNKTWWQSTVMPVFKSKLPTTSIAARNISDSLRQGATETHNATGLTHGDSGRLGSVESFLVSNGCGNCHKCGTPVEKPSSSRAKVAAQYAKACGIPVPTPGPAPPPSPGPGPQCTDVSPDSNSCADQKKWGKCSASFMKGYCCQTCFNCASSCTGGGPPPAPTPPPSCTDVGPDSHSCADQKKWGKCGSSFMKGYCCRTCFGCDTACGRAAPQPTANGVCSTEEFAVVLSIAMQESDSMEKTDTSKSGGAKNVSPFNMNLDELALLGCDSACADGLGQGAGGYDFEASVMWLLKGLRGGTPIGDTEDFLNYQRDGVTGWKACKGKGPGCDCGSKGCKAYRDAIADAANLLLQEPSTMANGQRVCENTPHIGRPFSVMGSTQQVLAVRGNSLGGEWFTDI